jgi:hypothetical protein
LSLVLWDRKKHKKDITEKEQVKTQTLSGSISGETTAIIIQFSF